MMTLSKIWSFVVLAAKFLGAFPGKFGTFVWDHIEWLCVALAILMAAKMFIAGNMKQQAYERALQEDQSCAISCLPYVSRRIEVLGQTKCYCYNNLGMFEPNE